MQSPQPQPPQFLPLLGCLGMALAVFFLCLLPVFMVKAMHRALERLHLSPQMATLAIIAIFAGSLINLPVHEIEREDDELEFAPQTVFWMGRWTQRYERVRDKTVIAVNVGGCVIPLLLAVWQIRFLATTGGWPLQALLIAAAANVAVCYFTARPVPGLGILMPGLVAPVTAVTVSFVLLFNADYAMYRAPVAFVAGVSGPLIGADLLHLKDIAKASVGMLSIGGAGTFDGIVLSGVLAALFA